MLKNGCSLFKGDFKMDNKQITQEQFVIEKLATENARLRVAIEQLNFKILVQEQEIENLKSKGENKE